MPFFEHVSLPWCDVLRCESWNAPPGRFYLAYRTRMGFHALLGQGVVDEYRTVSSPLFFAPRALLGKIYNAGISLGHRRDPEMGLDEGWPPLCVGLDLPVPTLPADWEKEFVNALESEWASGREVHPTAAFDGYTLERRRFGEATVYGTNAPLLPHQLERLCDADSSAITLAIATGNRIDRGGTSRINTVRAVSEETLARLVHLAAGMAQDE